MILKVSPSSTSLSNPTATPGPAEGCYYVKIKNVPEGVSVAQVILLFTHTARKVAEKDQRHEFDFTELCPSASW